MYIARNTSLAQAIVYATQDIAAYMKEPRAWIDEYYHTTESAEGRMRYQVRQVEQEIAEAQENIKNYQLWIASNQKILQEKERQARHFREQLENISAE